MRRESGFTLIELVVVIVILGILAAFAVPRFVGMQDEARTSAMEGLQGSLYGSASLAHGKQLAADKNSSENIDATGKTITMNGGWPAANASGIVKMLQDTSAYDVKTSVSSCNSSLGSSPNCVRFRPSGLNSTSCFIDYSNNDTAYEVNSTLSDCS